MNYCLQCPYYSLVFPAGSMGERGCQSGESTRLPPIGPLLREVFSKYPGIPFSSKTNVRFHLIEIYGVPN